mmetsp:Transcript_89558/g.148879  ORF Transcript_89558/g.148879 Transcript_89558/m.148879 type:complete len:102 (+) Transcript_89558:173-478(+)
MGHEWRQGGEGYGGLGNSLGQDSEKSEAACNANCRSRLILYWVSRKWWRPGFVVRDQLHQYILRSYTSNQRDIAKEENFLTGNVINNNGTNESNGGKWYLQ